ncbi:hypothetical protein HPP92_020316 [Vanilla planifolia]|uniref:Uncharacterized protein n=1 Tax=Vanilla planifolia TaxID=51239 RepID=A0A835QAH4_VANPL|nr:hypothetical protein HPP92_020316 [Vanilla planifolia]
MDNAVIVTLLTAVNADDGTSFLLELLLFHGWVGCGGCGFAISFYLSRDPVGRRCRVGGQYLFSPVRRLCCNHCGGAESALNGGHFVALPSVWNLSDKLLAQTCWNYNWVDFEAAQHLGSICFNAKIPLLAAYWINGYLELILLNCWSVDLCGRKIGLQVQKQNIDGQWAHFQLRDPVAIDLGTSLKQDRSTNRCLNRCSFFFCGLLEFVNADGCSASFQRSSDAMYRVQLIFMI